MKHTSEIGIGFQLAGVEFCPKCDHPIRDGVCWNCEETKRNEDDRARSEMQRLGGLKAYQRFTLDNYTNKAAIALCQPYPSENLYLWGKAGTGKTHLATALVRNHRGIVIKPQDIFRDARGQTGEGEKRVIESYIKPDHLVIDDLGVDKQTQFSFSILYEIIDGRYMWDKKGLIITSNLSLSELSTRLDDDRITSRLTEMCRVIELTGSDKRLGLKGGKND